MAPLALMARRSGSVKILAALVAFVGLMDPLKGVTQIVRADIDWKGIYWEPYIFVGVIFFVFCFGMSRYSMYLEKKLKTDHR